MRKVRTVLVVSMNGDGPLTGYSSRVRFIVSSLKALGFNAVLLRFHPAFKSGPSWKESFSEPNIKLFEIPIFPYSKYQIPRLLSLFFVGLVSHVAAVVTRAVAIIAESHDSGGAVLGWRLTQKPIVVDIHGAAVEEAETRDRRCGISRSRKWLKRAELRIVKEATGCFVVSPRMETLLRSKHNDQVRSKFWTVPISPVEDFFENIDDDTAWKARRDSARNSLGIPKNASVLVYCGGGQEYQCIPEMHALLVSARKQDPTVYLLVITSDPAVFERQFRGFEDAMTIVSVQHSEVPMCLMAADAGLLLRRDSVVNHVAAPTKLAEYLAVGLPVITTEHAGNAGSVLQGRDFGLVLELSTDLTGRVIEFLHKKHDRVVIADFARTHLHFDNARRVLNCCLDELAHQRL
jgi:glycosyltransferase involved in cell wall biosynthesis